MSILKYFEDGKPRTQDGFPIRGNFVPFLKQQEFEDIPLGIDAHVDTFATDVPDDMEKYQSVLDKIANGAFVRLAPDREEFVAERKAWLILVRWGEVKGEISQQMMEQAGGFFQ